EAGSTALGSARQKEDWLALFTVRPEPPRGVTHLESFKPGQLDRFAQSAIVLAPTQDQSGAEYPNGLLVVTTSTGAMETATPSPTPTHDCNSSSKPRAAARRCASCSTASSTKRMTCVPTRQRWTISMPLPPVKGWTWPRPPATPRAAAS